MFQLATGQTNFLVISAEGNALFQVQSQDGLGGGNTITYNADTDSFSLKVTQGAAQIDSTFSPANIIPGPVTTATIYGNGTASFILIKPGAAGLGLDYVTYGTWSIASANTRGYSVFGVRTEPGSVPKSGAASFSGPVGGIAVDGGRQFSIAGTFALTADFTAGSVTGDFSGMTKSDLAANTTPWHDLTLNANISGNAFAGTLQAKDISLGGTAAGGFFGPGAPEIGGSWAVENTDIHAVGVFLGKRP